MALCAKYLATCSLWLLFSTTHPPFPSSCLCLQPPKLLDFPAYRKVLDTLKQNLAEKGRRPSGRADPQHNTQMEALSYDELSHLVHHVLAQEDHLAIRDRACFTWMTCTVGRGDDSRLVFLADCCEPTLMCSIGMWLQAPC